MSAQPNKRAVIVGIFIALGLAILVAGVLTLGGQQKRFVRTVPIIAIFDNVSGLKVGDNVWFSGVRIGTVRRILFVANAQVEVDLRIEEKSQMYIRKDAHCEIGSDGLIGNRVVTIIGGSSRTAPVEAGDRLLTRTAPGTEQLLDTLQLSNRKLLTIMTGVERVVAQVQQGHGTAGALLTDPAMAAQVRAAVADLKTTTENTNRLTITLARFADRLNTRGTLAHELVSDTVVFHELRRSARELHRAAASVVTITDNARRLTDKLNTTDNAIGSLLNDPMLNRQVKTTLQHVESSSKKLDDDLEAVQQNILLRGFFRRRAKNAATQKATTPPTDSARTTN
jgi:phospholipid/cholesterol/gamma-HCH transport system substrate-binding protein